jgi:hypothetical protein
LLPPKTAYQTLIKDKLYKTVNSPTKLKVGKATDANTKIKNNEANFELVFVYLSSIALVSSSVYDVCNKK